jgi:hypothetical protein
MSIATDTVAALAHHLVIDRTNAICKSPSKVSDETVDFLEELLAEAKFGKLVVSINSED